jgi:hypothetical protein
LPGFTAANLRPERSTSGTVFSTALSNVTIMKDARSQNNQQSKQGMSHKPRPEVRDNLDSRSNEEQDFKGDDLTHNIKDTKNDKLKKKKK